MAMDLEGVKRRLTEGYERINKMKNSTSKIETCRAILKAREDKVLSDVKTMMNYIEQQLQKAQQSMESSIKDSVAYHERQLDARKKNIHDGYANLVKVCVEADKILRGRNIDLLGRSCQRLFCKFEAANLKLDAAEKIDTEALVYFELQDHSKQFLSNTCLAHLQCFHRYGKNSEVDEFWVDYESTDGLLVRRKEMTRTISAPNHTDCSSIRPATTLRSPESTGFSPKQFLETIQEVPEDNSPSRPEKADMKSKPQPAPEVVHIREQDLCVGRCCCCFAESKFIPPPPGFPRLKEPRLEVDNSIQQYTHLQNKMGFAMNSKWTSSKNPQDDSYHFTNGLPEGDFGTVSRSDAIFGYGLINEPSCIAYKPVRSYPASPQNLEINPKVRRLNKSAERCGDADDFIWDSDDSVDLKKPVSSSLVPHKEAGKRKLNNGSSGKSSPIKPVVVKAPEQKAACLDLDSKCNAPAHSYIPQLGLIGQQSAEEHGDSMKENHLSSREQNGHFPERELVCIKGDVTVTDMKQGLTEQVLIKQDVEQTEIKEEVDDVVDKKEIKQGVTHADVIKEEEVVFVKTARDSGPVRKSTVSPVEVTKDQEGASPKATEISRPLKTISRRLDLSHMLHHIGRGLFVIHAKCIEKIRGDFDHPIGVCTNSKGNVIVADTNNHIVKVCNNGQVIKKLGEDLKMRRPSAVVVNEKDEIFVKDDNCLYHFNAEGQFVKAMGKRLMNTPYGLGMTKDGKLIVVDALYSNGRMHVFQQDGTIDTYPYYPLRNQFEDSKCRFLAVHGEDVLTSDLGRSCLYLTNQQGELSKTLGRRGKRGGELNEPAGVAVDSVGNWIVADSKNHRVQVFAQNGYFMGMLNFTGESIRRPSGIHLTSDGLLYIINYLDSVIKVFKLGAS